MLGGAPRSMKMGTTRSPSPYDAAACHTSQPAKLRRSSTFPLRLAGGYLPDFAGGRFTPQYRSSRSTLGSTSCAISDFLLGLINPIVPGFAHERGLFKRAESHVAPPGQADSPQDAASGSGLFRSNQSSLKVQTSRNQSTLCWPKVTSPGRKPRPPGQRMRQLLRQRRIRFRRNVNRSRVSARGSEAGVRFLGADIAGTTRNFCL